MLYSHSAYVVSIGKNTYFPNKPGHFSPMKLFDAWPKRYAAWFRTPIGRLVYEVESNLVLEMLRVEPGTHLLDAGCGSGLFTEPLIARGARVIGLDTSLPMLVAARDTLDARVFLPLAGDIGALPFADDSFDGCVSITALEFIADGRQAIDELFRVTRSGGQVLVATLNRLGPWASRRETTASKNPGSVFRHAHFRTPDELAALAPVTGVVRSAVHFARETPPDEAPAIERDGASRGLPTGAFVVASWRKP
jgi:ubiquinone/menaquinone biosynthesis C-methylase UbiE